ncbi:hypothetical protein IQ238_12655 [Pleurocapsales cyanobacterium LEGE 06147]|nr:hypothetical protein [Pleurocapsales cyanobacterium LEGE 06147]
MSRENKNPSVKPNTNAEALQDLAADPATDPQGIVTEGLDFVRSQEAPENESATQSEEEVKINGET